MSSFFCVQKREHDVSWSIFYIAQGKAAARKRANTDTGLPNLVRALIVDGINGIQGHDNGLISVDGHGHQADGASYSITSAKLEIKPLEVTAV